MLEAVSSLEEFSRAPHDRYLTRNSWTCWRLGDGLAGFIVRGDVNESDAQEIIDLIQRSTAHDTMLTPRVMTLLDVRDAGLIRAETFASLALHVKVRMRVVLLGDQSLRQAFFVGAAYLMLRNGFEGAADSYEECAARGLIPQTLVPTLNALSQPHDLVRRLRVLLAEHPMHGSVVDAASALGTSTRSLQRALERAGTSFRQEKLQLKAEHLRTLVSSDTKIDALAAHTGFASAGAFARSFRRLLGDTPSTVRASVRR